MDAAHFVLNPYLGYIRCFLRQFIRTPSGRKRFNVPGASDSVTHEVVTITNDAYINAESVCQLISQRNFEMPITVVSDNARYQKCIIVKELAEKLRIELLYLPPYSPDLNIIERLWKFIKNRCLYSKYYENFDLFKNAISKCISETHSRNKKELDTLLNLKFQTFEKKQIFIG